MSTRIYLDNAATSWPKPEAVYAAVDRYLRQVGAAAGRGVYHEAMEAEAAVMTARTAVARLLEIDDPRRIVLTHNGTDSLNLAIHGLVRPGDHVVTTVCEHNSVLRPLRQLERLRDVQVTRVNCNGHGVVDSRAVLAAVRPETRLVVMTHTSNVTGALQPAAQVGQMLKSHRARFLVDAAQSLGHRPLSVARLGADLLAAPGHKGLLGPLGTGILYVGPGMETDLESVRQGGTGTVSHEDRQPDTLPDKYESGNHNLPGIVGLTAGAEFICARGLATIQRQEHARIAQLLDGLRHCGDVRLVGSASAEARAPVVSFQVAGYDPREVAAALEAAHGIQVRAGLHCAPRMHRALGTDKAGGTVRISPGLFTTAAEIDAVIKAVAEMAGAV